jgi:hypothetical protein
MRLYKKGSYSKRAKSNFGWRYELYNFCKRIWGINARSDPLAAYFNKMIQGEGLIDLEPVNLLPTWRNGRGNQDSVEKRLDRFLISESLMDSRHCFRSWVVNVNIYDHMLVVFQMEPPQKR